MNEAHVTVNSNIYTIVLFTISSNEDFFSL